MASTASPEPSPASQTPPAPVAGQKRSAPSSSNNNNNGTGFRAVKRRASKACQCCRARKVRCNVVEHGAPCTNCRLDEVECIVTESKRRKKNWGLKLDSAQQQQQQMQQPTPTGEHDHEHRGSPFSVDGLSDKEGSHVPHLLYQTQQIRRSSFASSHASLPSLTHTVSTASSTASSYVARKPSLSYPNYELPGFIKPTPTRIPAEDLEYLWKKGALVLPDEPLQNALLDAHFTYVHPYMPLLDKRAFMQAVNSPDGSKGKIGLLLFQAVMFSGTAFVDMEYLRAAGYQTRKAARKDFFIKARLLYDFDHEQDRMLLVQALLLMSYWYETPDDQKDTWHWMGVAISLSHTIGLHRNPEKSNMDDRRKKLWKRIWWSCFMRDRLVALGMRRPTRIKSEDCDVPMLTLDDFSIDVGIDEEEALFWTPEQRAQAEKNVALERRLAIMCIEKAKLCVCISHVLSAQYSVLNTNQGSLTADGTTRTTMMLLPKKLEPGSAEVLACDRELESWAASLPQEALYQAPRKHDANGVLILHLNLLHLIYNTTVSALHRPQVLPSTPASPPLARSETQESSRRKVRAAASEITRLADDLIEFDLVRFLPTTGVTVILPAVIIHLLDIKSSNPHTREMSLEGFALCMQVLQRLRQTYSAADYATHFLEAAIKKAGIPVENLRKHATRRRARYQAQLIAQQPPAVATTTTTSTATTTTTTTTTPTQPVFTAIAIPNTAPPSNAALTPPPDLDAVSLPAKQVDESDLQLKLESFLHAAAPPSPSGCMDMDDLWNDSVNSSEIPEFTMPEVGSADAMMGGDPFLGHDGVVMPTKGSAFNWGGSWGETHDVEMGGGMAGEDLSFEDVIQVLETEIN